MQVTIRAETADHFHLVEDLVERAFGQPDEADLIRVLRSQIDPRLSLVAEVNGEVAGHILFSGVRVEGDAGSWQALGLGPMAVDPPWQRQGIGSRLVRAGLDTCLALGHEIVVVVGHPEYYPRFGFVPAVTRGLRCVYTVPPESFMVKELRPGALAGRQGTVHYLPAFDAV